MEWIYKFEIEDSEDLEAEMKDENATSAIIFLIDCGRILFENNVSIGDSKEKCVSWFEAIIKSCLAVVKNKAMTTDKDHISIIFYRVKTESDVIMKNVYIFQALEQPGIDEIKKIMALEIISQQNFDKAYGFSDQCSLFHAIWCCQNLFAKCKVKFGNKQILLFTFDDDPSFGKDNIKKSLIVKIRDLKQNDISLEIMPVANPAFDEDKFYKALLASNTDSNHTEGVSINKSMSKFDELMIRTRHKQYKKRTSTRIPWFLGDDSLSIHVGVYNLVRKSPPPSNVSLERKTNSEITRKRIQVIQETGQTLLPFDMKYCMKIMGKNIVFEKEEINKMRAIIEPGIRLIGFKPMKYLKSYYQFRTAQFLYPDETCLEGSTKLFTALLKRCYDRNVFALCVYVPRKSSQLQFVALVPQLEKLNSSMVQIQPPGFSAIFLPFEDDIRKLDVPICYNVQDEDRKMSEQLIKSLSVEYDPETIFNPVLQRKLAVIEAIALDLEKPDKIEDNTVVNNEEINDHCGPTLELYKEYFQLTSPESSSGPKVVKPKIDVDLEQLYKLNKLESLTIPQLKAEASTHGIKIRGSKKADIIQSIVTHFKSIR